MEQYKVILVDDEVEVIDVMKKKIRWDDLGFDVVGSATNGVKALELVEKLQPDVVLTDIKMPSFKDYPKADFNAENFLTDFGNTTSNTI